MRRRFAAVMIAAWMLAGPILARVPGQRAQLKDYLSEEESDKIRDAREPAERIKLYISFADDRLKKFDYELKRPAQERRQSDILNGLLNGYAGCVDDAADQIDLAREKHADIREALKLMQTKEKAFLDQLEKYDKDGPDLDVYRDTLEDAIEGTKDAISDAQDAQKETQAPPVRRPQ
jgi:hypothetical protein